MTLAACDNSPAEPALDGLQPSFAHESNNGAELVGDGVRGSATVNFVRGAGDGPNWRSTAHLRGLDPGSYDFYFTLNGANETLVCSFLAGMGGTGGCSGDTNVPGFNTGEIRTIDGTVVASGTFARRGGNRFES